MWRRMKQKPSNIQQRALQCPPGSLENSRRLLIYRKLQEGLPKGVQAVLKNNDLFVLFLRYITKLYLCYILYLHVVSIVSQQGSGLLHGTVM